MIDNVGVITATSGYYTELGSVITQGGLVRLKNLGPGIAWIRTIYAGDPFPGLPASASDNSWPLAPGDECTVIALAYPVDVETPVPGVTTVGTPTYLAYSVIEAL